jgi:lipoprotein NlpI
VAGTAADAASGEPQCGGVSSNPARAIEACTRAIEFMGLDRRDLAEAYYSRGTEWARQGNLDRAIGDYNVALQLEPDLAFAYYNRALAWSAKGESDRALADYDAALERNPGDVAAHVGRGAEWIVKGDYRRAIADYDEAVAADGKSLDAVFGRGRARLYAGDYMLSASDLYRAHDLKPSVYTALWAYLARKRAGLAAEAALPREAATRGSGSWPAPVVGLYLGNATPDEVKRAAVHPDAVRQREIQCEASFYIGEWHALRGADDAAAPLFGEAARDCARSFIEREGAVAALRRLR